MRTRWMVVPVLVLALAGCGQPSRVDEVVDRDTDQPRPLIGATSVSASPAVAPTTASAEPVVEATTKPAVKKPSVKKPKPKKTTVEPEPVEVFYANCSEVRDAGADPIRRGDPGYSRKLDRDGDGVACE